MEDTDETTTFEFTVEGVNRFIARFASPSFRYPFTVRDLTVSDTRKLGKIQFGGHVDLVHSFGPDIWGVSSSGHTISFTANIRVPFFKKGGWIEVISEVGEQLTLRGSMNLAIYVYGQRHELFKEHRFTKLTEQLRISW